MENAEDENAWNLVNDVLQCEDFDTKKRINTKIGSI